MTTTNTTPKAAAVLKTMTTRQLIDTFIVSGIQIEAGHHDSNLYTVRGWLIDELERRDPDAFDAWMESDESLEDEATLYNYFTC